MASNMYMRVSVKRNSRFILIYECLLLHSLGLLHRHFLFFSPFFFSLLTDGNSSSSSSNVMNIYYFCNLRCCSATRSHNTHVCGSATKWNIVEHTPSNRDMNMKLLLYFCNSWICMCWAKQPQWKRYSARRNEEEETFLYFFPFFLLPPPFGQTSQWNENLRVGQKINRISTWLRSIDVHITLLGMLAIVVERYVALLREFFSSLN